MVPSRALNLTSFTLCLRLATELTGKREVIFFAYRTQNFDTLNVWRELSGRLSLYLSNDDGVMFDVPELGPLENHLCFTWDSSTGQTVIYINGQRSGSKFYHKGDRVQPGGSVLVGQDPDSFLGDFDEKQSFVGEIFEVNMWSSALESSAIQLLANGKRVQCPDVLNWDTVVLNPRGNVVLLS